MSIHVRICHRQNIWTVRSVLCVCAINAASHSSHDDRSTPNLVQAEKDPYDVGWPQVAMHRNCHFSSSAHINYVYSGDANIMFYCGCSILSFSSFFLHLVPLSHWNLRSLLLSGNKRDRLETFIHCVEWSQFAVFSFSSVIWHKVKNYSRFSISARHALQRSQPPGQPTLREGWR